ncbi:MAG: hypothetical protein HUU03_08940 [Planctomycetaceae bacterium]|nr:hypothetical protein [Planctomycetaceae bacterium]
MADESTAARASALTAMQGLFSGLESRLMRQRMLPHPLDGSLYDFDANRVSRRSHIAGDLSPGGQSAFTRREALGLLHKPLLGATTLKVCVVLDFAWAPAESSRFTPRAVEQAANWALTTMRPDIYFILGVAGLSSTPQLGPSDEALRSLSGGTNWRAGFVEFLNPGWRVSAPRDGVILPALFENLFDPEPHEQKAARVDAALQAAQELKEPGGFLLLEELARRAAVSGELVTDRAMLYAGRTPGLDVKDVEGNLIIQRNRFTSVGA